MASIFGVDNSGKKLIEFKAENFEAEILKIFISLKAC